MILLKYIFPILFICSFSGGFALAETDLSKININYLFDPAGEVQFNSRVAVTGSLASVYLKIDIKEGQKSNPDNYSFSYEVLKSYTDSRKVESDSLTSSHLIKSEGGVRYFKFDVPVTKNETLVLVKAVNLSKNIEYVYDIPVDLPLDFPKSSLLIMEKDQDLPIFKDFISAQDSFRIVSIDQGVDEVFFFYYSKQFSPADPPMAFKPVQIDKDMRVDSVSALSPSSPLIFSEPGLYFIQADTSSLEGLSLLVKDYHYPQLVRAETLVEPLVYISTAREVKKLKDNENKKNALDTYWLELTKSPERAKQIIRSYYQQVELANEYFTTYKEGWKTDQGMILMLFGTPDAVFNHGDYLEWIYERRGSMSRIKFNFTKVKNIFTNNHYELVRNPGYDRDWYRTVDQWRKGRQGT